MKTKLKTYAFQLRDSFFPQVFEGTIKSTSLVKAKKEVLDQYAYELDTTIDELTITIKESK